MSLIPRDEFLFPLEQTFNKLFDDFFHNKNTLLNVTKANSGYPKMNYYDDGEVVRMVFSVPGVRKEDLDIEYNDDHTLTLHGKMSAEYIASDKAYYYCRELRQSSFSRTVTLPEHSKPPTANLKDGILTLTFETEPIKEKPKLKIKIQ